MISNGIHVVSGGPRSQYIHLNSLKLDVAPNTELHRLELTEASDEHALFNLFNSSFRFSEYYGFGTESLKDLLLFDPNISNNDHLLILQVSPLHLMRSSRLSMLLETLAYISYKYQQRGKYFAVIIADNNHQAYL